MNRFIKKQIKKLLTNIGPWENIVLESLEISYGDNILILAPHADDESIGCGGLMLKHSNCISVICLTDGSEGDPSIEKSELIEIRKKEFENAMSFAKIKKYSSLEIQDGTLKKEFDVFKKIDIESYNYIFVPNILDQHPDHKAVCVNLSKLLKSKKSKAKICLYEVWNALSVPNVYIDITDNAEYKYELINKYKSQIKNIDYQNRALSLNNYRGMSVGCKYAEVYTMLSISEFNYLVN